MWKYLSLKLKNPRSPKKVDFNQSKQGAKSKQQQTS